MILIEIVPHLKVRGDWLVKSAGILPYPIWFTSKEHAQVGWHVGERSKSRTVNLLLHFQGRSLSLQSGR